MQCQVMWWMCQSKWLFNVNSTSFSTHILPSDNFLSFASFFSLYLSTDINSFTFKIFSSVVVEFFTPFFSYSSTINFHFGCLIGCSWVSLLQQENLQASLIAIWELEKSISGRWEWMSKKSSLFSIIRFLLPSRSNGNSSRRSVRWWKNV